MPRTGKQWEQRLRRADELAERYPFAKQILRFYSRLTAFQRSSYSQFTPSRVAVSAANKSLPALLDEVAASVLLPCWPPFVSVIGAAAPAPLAEFARGLKAREPGAVAELLRAAWPAPGMAAVDGPGAPGVDDPPGAITAPAPAFERFCGQAFLQPLAEFLGEHAEVPVPEVRRPTCPYCGSLPLVGVLRAEGEGAKRSLICSFCRTEWDYLRIACPACDERREEKLSVFTTPKFAAVRVEACGTCRAYTLTVDLSKDGLAVPEVDELAAIPLTLWADENGYQKFTRSVLCL